MRVPRPLGHRDAFERPHRSMAETIAEITVWQKKVKTPREARGGRTDAHHQNIDLLLPYGAGAVGF